MAKTENHWKYAGKYKMRIYGKMTKSLENEKCTLKDLEYGEKTENHGK